MGLMCLGAGWRGRSRRIKLGDDVGRKRSALGFWLEDWVFYDISTYARAWLVLHLLHGRYWIGSDIAGYHGIKKARSGWLAWEGKGIIAWHV